MQDSGFERSGRRRRRNAPDIRLRRESWRSFRGRQPFSPDEDGKRKVRSNHDNHSRARDVGHTGKSLMSDNERRKRKRTASNLPSRSLSLSRSRSSSRPRTRQRQSTRCRRQGSGSVTWKADNHEGSRYAAGQHHGTHQRRGRDYDQRRHSDRCTYSSDRQSGRRPRQRRQRRRRSPSVSSSSSISSSRPRLHAVACPRAWLVSDDDDAMASSHSDKRCVVGGTSLTKRGTNPVAHTLRRPGTASNRQAENDDSIGHFSGGRGTVIAETYRIERELGEGTFGKVFECLDLARSGSSSKSRQRHDNGRNVVAIKMVRKVKRYYESALIEAGIVSDVNRRGGRGTSHFAVMFDAFTFCGHYCLVFESLGPSLYDYLKRNKYRPFPMHYVRDFSRQLLEAIEFLHSFRLIHTDLKPENILLTNCREVSRGCHILPESTRIKIIDFGGATYDDEKKSSVINTRQYRAPEVILGCGWSMPSDLWSVGCILAELYQGELLFATHDNLEHLALIERIVGPFPRRMLQKASHFSHQLVNEAFDARGRHRMHKVLRAESVSYVLNLRQLESIVHPNHEWFLNLLRVILVIPPESRAPARHALRFFE